MSCLHQLAIFDPRLLKMVMEGVDRVMRQVDPVWDTKEGHDEKEEEENHQIGANHNEEEEGGREKRRSGKDRKNEKKVKRESRGAHSSSMQSWWWSCTAPLLPPPPPPSLSFSSSTFFGRGESQRRTSTGGGGDGGGGSRSGDGTDHGSPPPPSSPLGVSPMTRCEERGGGGRDLVYAFASWPPRSSPPSSLSSPRTSSLRLRSSPPSGEGGSGLRTTTTMTMLPCAPSDPPAGCGTLARSSLPSSSSSSPFPSSLGVGKKRRAEDVGHPFPSTPLRKEGMKVAGPTTTRVKNEAKKEEEEEMRINTEAKEGDHEAELSLPFFVFSAIPMGVVRDPTPLLPLIARLIVRFPLEDLSSCPTTKTPANETGKQEEKREEGRRRKRRESPFGTLGLDRAAVSTSTTSTTLPFPGVVQGSSEGVVQAQVGVAFTRPERCPWSVRRAMIQGWMRRLGRHLYVWLWSSSKGKKLMETSSSVRVPETTTTTTSRTSPAALVSASTTTAIAKEETNEDIRLSHRCGRRSDGTDMEGGRETGSTAPPSSSFLSRFPTTLFATTFSSFSRSPSPPPPRRSLETCEEREASAASAPTSGRTPNCESKRREQKMKHHPHHHHDHDPSWPVPTHDQLLLLSSYFSFVISLLKEHQTRMRTTEGEKLFQAFACRHLHEEEKKEAEREKGDEEGRETVNASSRGVSMDGDLLPSSAGRSVSSFLQTLFGVLPMRREVLTSGPTLAPSCEVTDGERTRDGNEEEGEEEERSLHHCFRKEKSKREVEEEEEAFELCMEKGGLHWLFFERYQEEEEEAELETTTEEEEEHEQQALLHDPVSSLSKRREKRSKSSSVEQKHAKDSTLLSEDSHHVDDPPFCAWKEPSSGGGRRARGGTRTGKAEASLRWRWTLFFGLVADFTEWLLERFPLQRYWVPLYISQAAVIQRETLPWRAFLWECSRCHPTQWGDLQKEEEKSERLRKEETLHSHLTSCSTTPRTRKATTEEEEDGTPSSSSTRGAFEKVSPSHEKRPSSPRGRSHSSSSSPPPSDAIEGMMHLVKPKTTDNEEDTKEEEEEKEKRGGREKGETVQGRRSPCIPSPCSSAHAKRRDKSRSHSRSRDRSFPPPSPLSFSSSSSFLSPRHSSPASPPSSSSLEHSPSRSPPRRGRSREVVPGGGTCSASHDDVDASIRVGDTTPRGEREEEKISDENRTEKERMQETLPSPGKLTGTSFAANRWAQGLSRELP